MRRRAFLLQETMVTIAIMGTIGGILAPITTMLLRENGALGQASLNPSYLDQSCAQMRVDAAAATVISAGQLLPGETAALQIGRHRWTVSGDMLLRDGAVRFGPCQIQAVPPAANTAHWTITLGNSQAGERTLWLFAENNADEVQP